MKVQRPRVAGLVRRDLEILQRLAGRLERRTRWARDLQLSEVAQAFADNVIGELDFQAEARNLAAVRSAVRRHQQFLVPQAIPALTRSRVLVMDWIEGTRLADATETLANDDREELARALLGCFLDLPRRLDKIMEAAERNELAVGVHLFAEEHDRRLVDRLTAPLIATVAGASTGLIGGLLLLAANRLLATTTGRLLQALGIGGVTVALLTSCASWSSRFAAYAR